MEEGIDSFNRQVEVACGLEDWISYKEHVREISQIGDGIERGLRLLQTWKEEEKSANWDIQHLLTDQMIRVLKTDS